MLNSQGGPSKSSGALSNQAAILEIEELANQGEILLAAQDFEGAFIAWLSVYRIAEEIFGMDDEVAVDALRLAMNSLGYLQRFNNADRILRKASSANSHGTEEQDASLENTEWVFAVARPHQVEEASVSRPSPYQLSGRYRRRRGPASSPVNPLRIVHGHRVSGQSD